MVAGDELPHLEYATPKLAGSQLTRWVVGSALLILNVVPTCMGWWIFEGVKPPIAGFPFPFVLWPYPGLFWRLPVDVGIAVFLIANSRRILQSVAASTGAAAFFAGFLATAFLMIYLNLVPLMLTWRWYHTDGFEVVGFPLIFRRIGGFPFFYEFFPHWLLVDIGIGLVVAVGSGIGLERLRRARSSSWAALVR